MMERKNKTNYRVTKPNTSQQSTTKTSDTNNSRFTRSRTYSLNLYSAGQPRHSLQAPQKYTPARSHPVSARPLPRSSTRKIYSSTPLFSKACSVPVSPVSLTQSFSRSQSVVESSSGGGGSAHEDKDSARKLIQNLITIFDQTRSPAKGMDLGTPIVKSEMIDFEKDSSEEFMAAGTPIGAADFPTNLITKQEPNQNYGETMSIANDTVDETDPPHTFHTPVGSPQTDSLSAVAQQEERADSLSAVVQQEGKTSQIEAGERGESSTELCDLSSSTSPVITPVSSEGPGRISGEADVKSEPHLCDLTECSGPVNSVNTHSSSEDLSHISGKVEDKEQSDLEHCHLGDSARTVDTQSSTTGSCEPEELSNFEHCDHSASSSSPANIQSSSEETICESAVEQQSNSDQSDPNNSSSPISPSQDSTVIASGGEQLCSETPSPSLASTQSPSDDSTSGSEFKNQRDTEQDTEREVGLPQPDTDREVGSPQPDTDREVRSIQLDTNREVRSTLQESTIDQQEASRARDTPISSSTSPMESFSSSDSSRDNLILSIPLNRNSVAESAQYSTAESAQYGTAESAQYGTAESAQYSTTESAQYGTAESAQYSTTESAQYGTTLSAQYSTTESSRDLSIGSKPLPFNMYVIINPQFTGKDEAHLPSPPTESMDTPVTRSPLMETFMASDVTFSTPVEMNSTQELESHDSYTQEQQETPDSHVQKLHHYHVQEKLSSIEPADTIQSTETLQANSNLHTVSVPTHEMMGVATSDYSPTMEGVVRSDVIEELSSEGTLSALSEDELEAPPAKKRGQRSKKVKNTSKGERERASKARQLVAKVCACVCACVCVCVGVWYNPIKCGRPLTL